MLRASRIEAEPLVRCVVLYHHEPRILSKTTRSMQEPHGLVANVAKTDLFILIYAHIENVHSMNMKII